MKKLPQALRFTYQDLIKNNIHFKHPNVVIERLNNILAKKLGEPMNIPIMSAENDLAIYQVKIPKLLGKNKKKALIKV